MWVTPCGANQPADAGEVGCGGGLLVVAGSGIGDTSVTFARIRISRSGSISLPGLRYFAYLMEIMHTTAACELWLTRVLEGQVGLSRFLADTGNVRLLSEWLTIQADIDRELASLWETDDIDRARQLFFSSQAQMEKFVVGRISYDAMTQWVAHSAAVHRSLSPMDKPTTQFPQRLGNQLRLYDSAVDNGECYTVIRDCGIWQYREKRRAAGVPITLESPCEFCVQSVSANASAHRLSAAVTLRSGARPGCDWTFADE